MKLGQHKLKEVPCNEVIKTYFVFDPDKERIRPINGHDIIEEGTVVYKHGKPFEIFLYDFVNKIYFLEEVKE